MTVPISHCQGQAGFDCLLSEASKLKSANASLRTRTKRPAKQPQLQRLAVFRVTAAATAAQTQADSTQSQTSSQAPQQKPPWQSVASGLVSSLQRHRRENHLPLCRAFGVESLAHLRVSYDMRHLPIQSPAFSASSSLFALPQQIGDGLNAALLSKRTVISQDVFNCMCLSEGVYKVVDYGEEKATQILGAILEGFPPGLVSLKHVEWSRPDSNHRQDIQPACNQQRTADALDAVSCSCACSRCLSLACTLRTGFYRRKACIAILHHSLAYSQKCHGVEHTGCMHRAVQICRLVCGLPGLQRLA